MRITENLRMQTLLRNIQNNSAQLSKLYDKIATQKEVVVPSDDPASTATIMRMTAYIETLNQHKDSIATAQSFIDAVMSTGDVAADTILRAETLAVGTLNGTLSATELSTFGDEANQFLESLVQYANQSFDGRYLFAGTKTDTTPFAVTRGSDGEIDTIAYVGSSAALEFPLGRNRKIGVSVPGDAAFVDSGLFDALKSLRDHLRNEDGLSEAEQMAALQADFNDLKAARGDFAVEVGKVGSRSLELQSVSQHTESAITQAETAVSRVRDADIAEIALNISTQTMIYEALLQVGANMINISLMNYI